MLFASAAFMFLFLPVSLAAFYLTPQRYRRSLLLVISAVFYMLANLNAPLSIVILLALSIATYFAGRFAARTSFKYVGIIAGAVAITLFFVFRVLDDRGELFSFPLGGAIWLLSCVSYVIDIARRDAEPARIDDTLLYIMFFPVMAAGPVIKYKDFVKYIDSMHYNVNEFASGVKLFAVGVIERLAIAAVMLEAYELIIETSDRAPDIGFGMFAAVAVFLAAYFAFAGWADMGVGIARMFGISLPRDVSGALWAYSPARYFSRIFVGLGDWLDDYIVSPLLRVTSLSRRKVGSAIASSLTVVLIALWVRFSLTMLIMALIVAAIMFILSVSGAEQLLKDSKLLRPIGFFLTFLLMSIFWTAGLSASLGDFTSLINAVSSSVDDYHIYYVYIVMSGGEYIVTAIAALLFSPLICCGDAILNKLPQRLRPIAECVGTLLLLAIFVFTLVYYMPQYPQSAMQAFKYFVF
ncbi:MAG: hypothetical protein IJY27_02155 [Clostridia bacterium]|nr:hypothetical protein [Clostridia bacterium]